MSFFVLFLVNFYFFFSIFSRFNTSSTALLFDFFTKVIAVISSICHYNFRFQISNQCRCNCYIMYLPLAQYYLYWITESLNSSMNFCSIASSASSYTFIAPFLAPVPSLCTLTDVLSILISCKSASFAKFWNIFSNFPSSCHFAKHL